MQKTGGVLGRESPFSAYHLYRKPSNFGENSKGTVYSGGNFFGKTAVPPEDYLFPAFIETTELMWLTSARLTRESENSSVFFKPLQKPCTINLAQRRIQKDRDQSK